MRYPARCRPARLKVPSLRFAFQSSPPRPVPPQLRVVAGAEVVAGEAAATGAAEQAEVEVARVRVHHRKE